MSSMKYDVIVGGVIGEFRRPYFAGFMKCFGWLPDRLAAKKLDATGIEFKQVDVLDWLPPSEKFGLVVTNLFPDCFQATQLKWLIPLLASNAPTEAGWLLATFREPEYDCRNIS